MITNILIVDRNPEDLEPSKKLLRETGKFEFQECTNVEELMKIEKPRFDLVILELSSESETIIRHILKNNGGKIPRFILSSSSYDEKYTSILTTLGVQLEFIDKPIQPNVLTKRVSYIFSERKTYLQTSLMKSEINQLDGLTATLSDHQKNVEDEINHFKEKVSVPIQSVISQILSLVNQKQELDQEGMILFLKKLMEQLHGDLYKPIFRDIEETLSENERRWLTESFNIPTQNVLETPVAVSTYEEFGIKDFILYHKGPKKPFPDGKPIELPYRIKVPPDRQLADLYQPMVLSPEFMAKTEFLRKLSYCPFEHKNKELKQHVLLMFQAFDLFRLYGIPIDRFKRLLDELHLRYLGNPYHNFYHAVDVCQFIFFLISEVPSRASHDFLTTFDVLVLLLSALFHDIDHPGRNNNFLISTNHLLSLRYNGISVLENHHCTEMFKMLFVEDYNLFPTWPREKMEIFRKSVIDTVLSTDMKNHFNFMAEFSATFPSTTKKVPEEEEEEEEVEGEGVEDGLGKDGVEEGPSEGGRSGGRRSSSSSYSKGDEFRFSKKRSVKILLMQLVMKSADICNQIRPFLFAKQWSTRCLNEFFAQGDLERKLGIPVNMLGDRNKVSTPDSQVKFIKFIVYPLIEQLENALGGACHGLFTGKLNANSDTWAKIHLEELARKKQEEEHEARRRFEKERKLKGGGLESDDDEEDDSDYDDDDDDDEEEGEDDEYKERVQIKKKMGVGKDKKNRCDDDDDDEEEKSTKLKQIIVPTTGTEDVEKKKKKKKKKKNRNRYKKKKKNRSLLTDDRNRKEIKGYGDQRRRDDLNEEDEEVELQQSCFRRCMDSLELEEYEFYTLSYAIIGVAFMFAIFRFLVWSSGGAMEVVGIGPDDANPFDGAGTGIFGGN